MTQFGNESIRIDRIFHAPLMATPAGIEPATNSLEGCCSIQLSYGAVDHI